ncbi:hypothetical protein JCM15764A_17710 [Geotalea toluenoxydans]
MYPRFNDLVDCFDANSIKIGLVTNGLLLHKVPKETLDKMSWCRISNHDQRSFSKIYSKHLSDVVTASSGVDWALS